MFKSCNYCRHRKKKCVLPHPSASRCADCEHLDLVCEFSLRQPSLKRRRTSQRIASSVSAAAAAGTAGRNGSPDLRWPHSATVAAVVKDGDCQLTWNSARPGVGEKIILKDRPSTAQESLPERYWRYVYPLTPFVPAELIVDERDAWDPFLQQSIDFAAGMWLHRDLEPEVQRRAGQLLRMAAHSDLTLPMVAGVLLLLLRVPLNEEDAQMVYHRVQQVTLADAVLPAPIVAGAVVTNTWMRLVGFAVAPLPVAEDYLLSYIQTLDHSTFAHHYIRITNLAFNYDRLRLAVERDGVSPEAKQDWSQLEYECLFWAVQLPSTLLDLRDELPARPEAIVIHSLHNLVLLSFYATVMEWHSTLGAVLALRPVPGVLHYICSLARSILICPREMQAHWALLSDIQAATARTLMRLWRQTRFENFRGLLNLWEDAENRFPDLVRRVREEIGSGPWTIDQTDGYSVFWTFRDLRSLHLEYVVPELTAAAASSPELTAAAASSPASTMSQITNTSPI